MKAKKYTINVSNSFLEFAHGGLTIKEFCIPDLKLFVNGQACLIP